MNLNKLLLFASGLAIIIFFLTGKYACCFILASAAVCFFLNMQSRHFVPAAVLFLTPLERRAPVIPLSIENIVYAKYLITLFLILLWFLEYGKKRNFLKKRPFVRIWIFGFSLLVIITTIASYNYMISLKGILSLFIGFVTFILFYEYLSRVENIKKIFFAFLIITTALCLTVVLQYVIMKYNKLLFLEKFIISPDLRLFSRLENLLDVTSPVRVNGTFGHPNALGFYLIYLFFIILPALFIKMKNTSMKILTALAAFLCCLAIYATNSRSIIIGSALGTSVIFLFYFKKRFILPSIMAVLLISSIFLFVPFPQSSVEKYFRVKSGISERDIIWKTAWSFFVKKPFLGYGLDSYYFLYSELEGPPLAGDFNQFLLDLISIKKLGYIADNVVLWTRPTPHNMYLTALLDMGIPGLVFICAFFYYLFSSSVKLLMGLSGKPYSLLTAASATCTGLFAAIIFRGFFEFSGFYKQPFECTMLSLIIALLFVTQEAVHGEHEHAL
ncbi:MAG: O-antigen ligase family protein [Candidatus Aureabacteria bacterium]|nr:O-antigen ligase family protein [Candidatus Auribacterota bacterium]